MGSGHQGMDFKHICTERVPESVEKKLRILVLDKLINQHIF